MRKVAVVFFVIIGSISFADQKTILVFGGKTGWIGQKMMQLIESAGHRAVSADSRLECRESIVQEIDCVRPDMIINCAGVTGVPNVDWCESNKEQTIRTNVIGVLNLVDIAFLCGIHVTNFGTGCIFEYDRNHPENSNDLFSEEDEPNFDGSFYSKTKIHFEKLALNYSNLLNLRLRMPISSDFHKKNFITKISRYQKVINVANSMTVLDDLLPVALDMTLKETKGNFNFVNPGVLSHNQVLDLYTKYVDPNFSYQNFSVEEQNCILKAKRSNNALDVSKLLKLYPNIPSLDKSIHRVLENMKKLKYGE